MNTFTFTVENYDTAKTLLGILHILDGDEMEGSDSFIQDNDITSFAFVLEMLADNLDGGRPGIKNLKRLRGFATKLTNAIERAISDIEQPDET